MRKETGNEECELGGVRTSQTQVLRTCSNLAGKQIANEECEKRQEMRSANLEECELARHRCFAPARSALAASSIPARGALQAAAGASEAHHAKCGLVVNRPASCFGMHIHCCLRFSGCYRAHSMLRSNRLSKPAGQTAEHGQTGVPTGYCCPPSLNSHDFAQDREFSHRNFRIRIQQIASKLPANPPNWSIDRSSYAKFPMRNFA